MIVTKPTKTHKVKIKREKHIIDAKGKILGRLATQIASLLRGKQKPQFTPHLDVGDFVEVVNIDKIRLSGKKLEEKIYYHYSGYPGGLKKITAKDLLKRDPAKLLHLAVLRMLPKNKLRSKMIKRLIVKK